MNAPIESHERLEDLERYLPQGLRSRSPAPREPKKVDAPATVPALGEEAGAQPLRLGTLPVRSARMPPGVGGPNIDWRPSGLWAVVPVSSAPFEGDVAIRALRQRLSLDPDFVPEPPVRAKPAPLAALLGRLVVVLVVATALACSIALFSMPDLRLLSFRPAKAVTVAAEQMLAGIRGGRPAPTARLVLEEHRAYANDPLPLGLALNGATSGEFALLTGLAAGTRISAGSPFGETGWRLAAGDLAAAQVYAPRDFVGAMLASIELHTADDALLDRGTLRLEWVGRPAAPAPAPAPRADPPNAPPVAVLSPEAVHPPIEPEELATMLNRGLDYLKMGDIAAARLVLRRAAGAGSAQAALALGATYDPVMLGEIGAVGLTGDAAQARTWYELAGQLGSAEAASRIARLAP